MLNLSRGIVFFLFLSVCLPVLAINNPSVIINEIAWMGTADSANNEWIELYNNTQKSINLDGWRLTAQDGTPNISLSGIIPASGFYLLERTDDETVPNIPADKIYSGALGNNGEYLILYNNLNEIIDELNYSAGWINGDNNTKQTMEKSSINWQTSENPRGTPKSQNSTGVKNNSTTIKTVQDSPAPIIEQPKNVLTEINYPTGIIINEILPSPEGSDEIEEWIEIFNKNNFEVDLSDWKISDTIGKTTTYIFSKETKIKNKSFLVLYRPTTKIVLNNDGDGLKLLNPKGDIVDEVAYGKAILNQSYNFLEEKWDWSNVLTPGKENLKETIIEKENEAKSINKEASENELAAIGEQIPNTSKSSSFSLLLASFIIAFLSGAVILFIKKLQQKGNLLQ